MSGLYWPRMGVAARIVLGTFMIAMPGVAQIGPIQFEPAFPFETQIITVTYATDLCEFDTVTTVTGNVVRTVTCLKNCVPAVITPIYPSVRVTFGPLPPGSYRYELYEQYDHEPSPVRQYVRFFTVTPVPIPVTSRLGAALLAGVLAITGTLIMRT